MEWTLDRVLYFSAMATRGVVIFVLRWRLFRRSSYCAEARYVGLKTSKLCPPILEFAQKQLQNMSASGRGTIRAWERIDWGAAEGVARMGSH